MDKKMKEMQEMQACDMLARFAKGKHPYISPKCEVIEVEKTNLICTSVPVSAGTVETEYEDKGEREGDDYDVDLGF